MIWKLVLTVFFDTIGFILAAYFFWKRLKEDFSTEEIFSLTLLASVSGLLLGRLVYIFSNLERFGFNYSSWFAFWKSPGFSLPGVYLAGILTLIYYSLRRKWDVWLVADSFSPPFLTAVLFFNFSDLVQKLSFLRLAITFLTFLTLLVAKRVEKSYRSFSWYKSGRIGFLTCFSTIAFFGPFLLLDIFLKKALYFEECLSGLIVALAAVSLYYRSGRDFKEDQKSLFSYLIKLKNGR